MSYMPDSAEQRRVPRLYIMAGVPGCGKSTWARRFFSEYQIVSTDVLREQKWPGEPYDHNRNPEVFDEFHRLIGEFLPSWDVVADATSLQSSARQVLRDIADKHGAEAHLVFFKNAKTAVARNAQREGQALVPPDAMEIMLIKYIDTLSAILNEEYTSITIIEDTT